MARNNILRIARIAKRSSISPAFQGSPATVRGLNTHAILRTSSNIHKSLTSTSLRSFSTTPISLKGIYPDTENPQTKDPEREATATEPTDLTIERYHEAADEYIDRLVAILEELQEAREDVDVEYSAGVLTLVFPPIGTYVINKQPPNKQIWLSSPVSGPKRYDWVILGESQTEKEDGGKGEWVYLRDGSTLTKLLEREVGIDLTEGLV